MSFQVQKPAAFFLLILLVPAILFLFIRRKKIRSVIGKNNSVHVPLVLNSVFLSLSYIMLVFAYSGISWGSNVVPVQKANRSVSFVFDISYSMEAADSPHGKTRLQSASEYASALLDYLDGIPVSVVLAKGDGVVAIPFTEDKESIHVLLRSLSPKLLTSVGSSLGSGVRTAINSVPEHVSSACSVWLFTDGEETDDSLLSALNDAGRYGVPVTIIGFGSEKETEVFSGDGVRKVSTALRTKNIKSMIDSAPSFAKIYFVDSSSVGSASMILKHLLEEGNSTFTSYETKDAPRYRIFLFLSIMFFVIAIVCKEFRTRNASKKNLILAIVVCALSFTSCSQKFTDGRLMLSGNLEWNRHDYHNAVADFFTVLENAESRGDETTKEYALYSLATTYAMQDEQEAALKRFSQISPDAPDEIRFFAAYNSGIISHRMGNYDDAVSFFKQALLINPGSVDAKVNLELSLREVSVKSDAMEQHLEAVQVSEDGDVLQNALYSILRESELSQWKNRMQEPSKDALDY